MADLICASKWQLALTGTIAGGYASDLFYTLYRLDPKRMKSMGYPYGSKGERRFIEKYGTVETVYELDEDIQFHSMSRGKAVGTIQVPSWYIRYDFHRFSNGYCVIP